MEMDYKQNDTLIYLMFSNDALKMYKAQIMCRN